MKYYLIFLAALLPSIMMAQVEIEFQPTAVDTTFVSFDISDEDERIGFDLRMTNMNDVLVKLDWEVDIVDFPLGWKVQVSDNLSDYTSDIQSSPQPVLLAPFVQDDLFVLHFFPSSIPGCGRCDIVFVDHDTQAPVHTLSYDIKLNDEDCDPATSINEMKNLEFSLYPNPTSGICKISADQHFDKVEIRNLSGQLLESNSTTTVDLQNFQSGVYLVMLYKNEEILSKRVFKY